MTTAAKLGSKSGIARCALLALACVSAVSCETKSSPGAAAIDSRSAPAVNSASSIDTASSATRPASQQSGVVEIYPASALDSISASLAGASKATHAFGQHSTHFLVQGRRIATGVPEVHDHWIDVAVVQAGRATLLTGGHVDGSHVESPGEHRGGTIVGGASRPVAVGDLVVIPAGIPHQYQVARGDSIRYLTIKVAQQ